MESLPDIVLDILRQRAVGKDDDQIADDLGIDWLDFLQYNNSLRTAISSAFTARRYTTADLSEFLGIPSALLQQTMKAFYWPHPTSRDFRCDSLRLALALGITTEDDIAKQTGLNVPSVRRYAAQLDLPLARKNGGYYPRKKSCPPLRRVA